MNDQAFAWTLIADYIRETFIDKFGNKAWYELISSDVVDGMETYKLAIDRLAGFI